jgi:hypothetical protein
VRGRDSVFMPSCTVPMFSNRLVISHMIQCDMPCSRSAIAVAAATAPTPTVPCDQSQRAVPAMPAVRPMLSVWLTISKALTRRIWP